MSKTSGNTVRTENWVRERGTRNERVVTKYAVRDSDGRFVGATNYRGSESK
jgi:hypothetical protein